MKATEPKSEMYIRFVVEQRDSRSDQPRGIFTMLYALEDQAALETYELEWFRRIERWFDVHLKRPERLTWSTRANAPARAITWLKMSAVQHVSRLRELASLLDHHGVPVQELRTDKPGYIVYEDEHQVAAIPFNRETP